MSIDFSPGQLDRIEANLIAGHNIISDPGMWTQDAFARDIRGKPTALAFPPAVCFCAVGAVRRAAPDQRVSALTEKALKMWVRRNTDKPSVLHYNDSVNHADVMKMFDGTLDMVRGMRV